MAQKHACKRKITAQQVTSLDSASTSTDLLFFRERFCVHGSIFYFCQKSCVNQLKDDLEIETGFTFDDLNSVFNGENAVETNF